MSTDPIANPIYRGVIPYVNVEGADAASALYQRAFGAKELNRMAAEDGRLMHCHLEINGGSLMLADTFPEHGHGLQPSHSYTMTIQVGDIDAWWARAIAAGGFEVTMPVQTMFWGDRYGSLRDPFGVHWALNQPAAAQG